MTYTVDSIKEFVGDNECVNSIRLDLLRCAIYVDGRPCGNLPVRFCQYRHKDKKWDNFTFVLCDYHDREFDKR